MGRRIFAEFKSDQNNDYVVEIYDTSWSVTSSSVSIGPGGFELNWDGDTDQIYSPIIGSSVTFGLYDSGETHMTNFITDFKQYQEERFYVVIKRNTNVFWYGWIIQDLIEVEDISKPTLYQFKAVDGISKMSQQPYQYMGYSRTIVDTLVQIIRDNTPVPHLTQTDVLLRTVSNYWSEEQTYSLMTDPLSITRFPTKVFANFLDNGTTEYSNGLDIIRELCLVFGCRFYFDNGQFRFEQFSSRDENDLREFKYLMDGTADSYDDVNVDYDVDQSAIYRSQGTFRFLPAVEKIQLTDVKKANVNILGGSVTYDSSFGDEINIGVVPSADNGRIYLEMLSRFETYISTPMAGTATPVFAVTIRLEPTDGSANQYWSNSLVSGVTSFSAGAWSTTLGTYKWAANSVTRQQNTVSLTAHNMVTGPLPKDGEIFLDITILGFYDANGSSTSFFTSGNSYDWAVTIKKARFQNDNSPGSLASVVSYATNPSTKVDSYLTIDLGEVKLYNGGGELGSLYVYDGTSWVPSGGWRVGNSGTFQSTAINVTADLMQFHNQPIQRWEGTIIHNVDFRFLLRFDSKEWIGMSASFNANTDELNGEWFYITPDDTNVTIGTPIDYNDTDFGNNDTPDPAGQYANVGGGVIAGMPIDNDNNSIGPFQQTATGGEITGELVVDGDISTEQFTIPNTAGTDGQILHWPETGTILEWDNVDKLYIDVRNDEGTTLPAGTPIYSKGEIGGSDRILVGKADASTSTKMPCIGITMTELNTTTTKDGLAIVSGIYNTNLSGFTGLEVGDIMYVANGGGLTKTKPTGSDLIQNVGIILKTNGTIIQGFKVSAIGRTNDVPNLTTGKVWVGTATNTAESGVIHLDETNTRLGVNNTTPTKTLDVDGDALVSGGFQVSLGSGEEFKINPANTDREWYIDTTNADHLKKERNMVLSADPDNVHASTTIGFRIDNSTLMQLNSSGNLGIGTTSQTEKLHVAGKISNDQFQIPNTAGTSGQVLQWPSTGTTLEWANAGGGGSSADTARFNHNFNHNSNNTASWYYLPNNTLTEAAVASTNDSSGIVALNNGYVSKVRMTIIDTQFVTGFATQTRIRVEVNGSVVYTSGYNTHGTLTAFTSIVFTLTSTDAPFSAGDQVVVRFNANGIWYLTHAMTEHTYS